MKLAARTREVRPSATLAMAARAQARRAAGGDILSMSAGEPDFDTPAAIKAAAARAMARGESKYTPVAGSAALRAAVAEACLRTYGFRPAPGEVMASTGGKQVLFNAISALADPGDEVLMARPYWVSYPDMVRLCGAHPVFVDPSDPAAGLPSAEDWRRHLGPRSRILVLNSPSNPGGAAYDEGQLRAIAGLVRQHPHLVVIADDIYSGLVYDGPFVGFAQVADDLRGRTLIASGVSKSYAMTGWRIGTAVGPAALIAAMTDLQGACTSGPCSIAQAAAAEALAGPQDEAEAMRLTFSARRDLVVAALAALPRISLLRPQGAFYVLVRIDAFFGAAAADSNAVCEHLLETVGLAAVPGAAFGAERHLRLSFALAEADIQEGVRRLGVGLAALR